MSYKTLLFNQSLTIPNISLEFVEPMSTDQTLSIFQVHKVTYLWPSVQTFDQLIRINIPYFYAFILCAGTWCQYTRFCRMPIQPFNSSTMFISINWIFHPRVPNTKILIIWTRCEIITWTCAEMFLYFKRTNLLSMRFVFTYFSVCSKIIIDNPSIPAPRNQRIALILPSKCPNSSNMSIVLI